MTSLFTCDISVSFKYIRRYRVENTANECHEIEDRRNMCHFDLLWTLGCSDNIKGRTI